MLKMRLLSFSVPLIVGSSVARGQADEASSDFNLTGLYLTVDTRGVAR